MSEHYELVRPRCAACDHQVAAVIGARAAGDTFYWYGAAAFHQDGVPSVENWARWLQRELRLGAHIENEYDERFTWHEFLAVLGEMRDLQPSKCTSLEWHTVDPA